MATANPPPTSLPRPALVLASTSRYRASLLRQLGLPFSTLAPAVDETARTGEPPLALALRLAEAKARAVLAQAPDSLVVGSDQVADLDGQALGKPGTAARARAQLAACSGRRVVFHTALCLADSRNNAVVTVNEVVTVQFCRLTPAAIAAYVEREQPLDCAGAFKVEGLGISLFERISSDDPQALVGLPLIRLTALLRAAGVDPLLPDQVRPPATPDRPRELP